MSGPTFDLAPSIDLAAELVSITERQHLNKVHWAVQLVRHALEHRPRRIVLSVRERFLEVAHDGDALRDDERALLFAVLEGPDEARQESVAELERRFGVTLLSLLLTSSRVELDSRSSLVAEGGRLRAAAPWSSSPGYRLRVWRDARRVREELVELRFYCRHASVPIVLNGRRINRELRLERALLARPFRTRDGSGIVGLPERGGMTRVRYYKHGVYFGVRQSLPSDGRPVELAFDASLEGHEDNFHASVDAANAATRSARKQLYAELPALFPTMPPAARARVKDIALGLPTGKLPAPLRTLPLFDTSLSSWRLSLDELERTAARLGYLPYFSSPHGRDDELPVLSPAETASVARLLDVTVRRALRYAPGGVVARARRWLSSSLEAARRPTHRPLPAELLDDGTRALLEALTRARDDVRFLVTDGGAPTLLSGGGRERRMYLPVNDPVLRRAVERFRERPDELDAIGASLLIATA